MRGLRYPLHVNASMRSRVLLLSPDDLQVIVTRLVRALETFGIETFADCDDWRQSVLSRRL
jgi:hypothetical protein